jgi:chromosome segregation ATPase
LPDDGERVHGITNSPETIHYSLESGKNENVQLYHVLTPFACSADARSETVDSEPKHAEHIVTCVTTTTTQVEERKGTGGVQTAGESTTSSRTSSGVQPSIQGGVRRKASSTHLPAITEAGQSHNISSASKAVESRRSTGLSKPMHNSALDQLLRIQRLHREEKDCILDFVRVDYDDYKRSYEEQFEAFQTENERLTRELSASTSEITVLRIQLSSLGDSYPGLGTDSQHDKVDSTITTTITTITTTITTVTTQIKQWKHAAARNKGQITISNKELDQFLLDLSTASSQITELQQNYAGLLRDFSSVRRELQVTISLRDEKDRIIATLTAEVAQWKNADAAKAQQITAVRHDSETLRRDLVSARKEVQTKASLIEERDRTIASFTAEVAQWKRSDVTKGEQIATARRNSEKLQTDLSASSSQMAELQRRYDAQSKELGSVRNELQANKSLVEEKDRTITTITAEVDQWKLADVTKAKQFAAEHQDKEKFQRDLAAFSSQTADLQKRYDAQSKDIVTIRGELQTKTSLLEEKEHTITFLTTEVAQAKREDSAKAEQIATARSDLEQLRRELSSASDRFTEIQERYAVQSKELESVRDEFRQIEILYSSGPNQGSGKPSKNAVAQQIARALEEKNKQMKELRDDLAVTTSRNTELQKSYEALSSEVSVVRDQLSVQASQHEGTTTSLTAQVEQWKRADGMKAEQIASTLKQVEKLQQDLSTSISQLSELQSRYKTQSSEFIAVRNELQTKTSSNEGKDRTIASLTAEVNQWKLADGNKAEEIAATLKQIEGLQRDVSTSASTLAELQGRYAAQSRDLISVRNELRTNTSLHEGKDHTISSLTVELDQWKRADATKAEQIATTIKQVERLQQDLSASGSQLAELQGRYEAQSRELLSVRNEFQIRISSDEDKDRTVITLAAQVEEWKRTDALKEERIVTIHKQAEDLQRELTSTSSHITELRQRYEVQSRELGSLQDQLKDKASGNDRRVSSLLSQVEEWKRLDATKGDELTTVRKDLEQLRRDLATSSSQIESWKRSDTTKTNELTVVQKDIEQFRRDLSTSSSQIVEYQQRNAELTFQIEQWKRSDAVKAEELATARQNIDQLQHDLSTSSSRITEFQQRYEAQSAELSSVRKQLQATSSLGGGKDVATLDAQIERWKRADAAKAEELEQLQHKLSASSSELDALRKSTSISEETRKVYEKITTEEKDYAAIIKLTTTVDEWLRADARRAEELALELAKRTKENEELRYNLVTLKEIYIRAPALKQIFQSETVEVQIKKRVEEESIKLKSALAANKSQLDGVQRFVTTADKYADTMIIQMLQKLNAEVQQNTEFMAERMLKDFGPRATKLTKEQSSAAQKVSESIGETLTGCLGSKERNDVALYLPIAFQAYLTYYLHSVISSWTIKKDCDQIISEIYERLQKSGKKLNLECHQLFC